MAAMTGQEARDDENRLPAHITEEDIALITRVVAPTIMAAMIAEGYRKHPEPEITDEMVERAAQALFDRAGASSWRAGWDQVPEATRAMCRDDARTALEAALRVPVGEGEQG